MPKSIKSLSLFPKATSSRLDPFFHERVVQDAGYEVVAGVDEAGRGPLAGPVVAAAVILGQGVTLPDVTDSKVMQEDAREAAFREIQRQVLAVGVGVISHRIIDETNILQASLEAMRVAVSTLDPAPQFLLVDGNQKIATTLPQRCVVDGDRYSKSISAASVVAKVYRDRIMRCYHEMYPDYGFSHNKGYGTRYHLAALEKHGACPVHRVTFRRMHYRDEGETGAGQLW